MLFNRYRDWRARKKAKNQQAEEERSGQHNAAKESEAVYRARIEALETTVAELKQDIQRLKGWCDLANVEFAKLQHAQL